MQEIAYKVVSKNGYGTNAMIFGESMLEIAFHKHPKLRHYFPVYEVGEIYTSYTPTRIFCFNSKEYAKSFIITQGFPPDSKILLVEGYNKVKNPILYPMCGVRPQILVSSKENKKKKNTSNTLSNSKKYAIQKLAFF